MHFITFSGKATHCLLPCLYIWTTSYDNEYSNIWRWHMTSTDTFLPHSKAVSTYVQAYQTTTAAVPADRMSSERNNKKIKYKNLCTETWWMWNMKCTIISVISGATSIVTKGLKDNWKPYQANIQQTCYKRQLYWEHHTQYAKYKHVTEDNDDSNNTYSCE